MASDWVFDDMEQDEGRPSDGSDFCFECASHWCDCLDEQEEQEPTE